MLRRACCLAVFALIILPDAAHSISIAYYKQAFKISRPKGNGDYHCYSHLIGVQGGGGGSAQPYRLETAFRVPVTWTVRAPQATDLQGKPLVIQGTEVRFQRVACAPGACEIDRHHAAPPDQKWVQFLSNQLPGDPGPSRVEFIVKYEFLPVPGEAIEGQPVATWLSNDGDDRHGWAVTDQYSESTATLHGPPAPVRGMAVTAVALVVLGASPLARRRKRWRA